VDCPAKPRPLPGQEEQCRFALPEKGYRVGTANAKAIAPALADETLNLSAADRYGRSTTDTPSYGRRVIMRIIINENQRGLLFKNGKFVEYLKPGKYVKFGKGFNAEVLHTDSAFKVFGYNIDVFLENAEVADEVDVVDVADETLVLHFVNGKYTETLTSGKYAFFKIYDKHEFRLVRTNTPEVSDDVPRYLFAHIPNTLFTKEIDDYEKQIHILLQLALREYVGGYRLDEILENRERMSSAVLARLKEKEAGYFVTFSEAGVKDIILPGEIRNIMNTVLIAEKKAQANVITRREEVASTRSLLNTAKLMDENRTLYKLKELEHLEKICDNVGSISVTGGTDLLSQLTQILKGA
jgi:regulator of protease activity HflC (stomatin/prohibitin superfamily)